ncbi:hypothetical protein OG204_19235 [Streptomyces sp. NBC_01387]|nr:MULTISPECIES: hypothetical protein [unclassified Streptomyces]WSC21059.1 hypothetical protein OIE60_15985 [Streptomyces sp. NBC_01766]WSV55063.1 hypothetical protein OG282_15920 [Streptomyces sp. NBC_01014]
MVETYPMIRSRSTPYPAGSPHTDKSRRRTTGPDLISRAMLAEW